MPRVATFCGRHDGGAAKTFHPASPFHCDWRPIESLDSPSHAFFFIMATHSKDGKSF
jgi:hypothetical protein